MENILYELTAGTLNQKYDKIINCRVVKPPHEKKGFYGADFFLDKRKGLKYKHKDPDKDFLDYKRVHGDDVFLYKDWDKHKIWILDGETFTPITPEWFPADDNSPKKMVIGRWPHGQLKTSGVVSKPELGSGWVEFPDLPGYSAGYVKFGVWPATNIQPWDYILFTSGSLKGVVNRVYLFDGNAYIIGTTARGTMPEVWDTFDVYTKTGKTIIIGHKEWVSMIVLNGKNPVKTISLMRTQQPVIDITNYDNNIFALTENYLYFSRSNLDSNTNFYPLDNFQIDEGQSLFPTGKSLMVFANTNKMFASANSTLNTIGYVGYDIDYEADPYSKKSYIFTDNSVQVMQKDKELMSLNINQTNGTAFNVEATNALPNSRGLFEDIEGWEFVASAHDRFISYIHRKDGKSTIFEWDKQLEHWLIHTFDREIYNIYDKYVVSEDGIAVYDGYLDDERPFEQEVNFSYNPLMIIGMPLYMRTIMGLIDTPVNLDLDWSYNIGSRLEKDNIKVSKYLFDNTRHDKRDDMDDLIEEHPDEEHDGCIVALQHPIMRSGRYFAFNYHWYNRFCIWPSIIYYNRFRPLVNETEGLK